MPMNFADIEGFIAHVRTLPDAVRKAQRSGLQTVAAEVKAEAKYALGTYQKDWKRLAPATMAVRVKAGYPADEPLLMDGALRDSIHYHTTTTTAVIGSNSPYAAAQEKGEPKRNLPARPYLVPAARRHEENLINTIGSRVAYALASQTPPSSGHMHATDGEDT